MISQPPSLSLEQAWKALLTPAALSAGILPSNIGLSQNATVTLHPCLQITTAGYRESRSVGPGSGVFESQTSIKYITKLSPDQISATQANTNFEYFVQACYWGGNPLSQTLAARLTTAFGGQFTCYAVKNFEVVNAVQALDKTWVFEIRCECWFMNRSNP